MDRGAWRAKVHRVANSWRRLRTHTGMCIFVKGLELKKTELSIVPEVNNRLQALVDWSHEGQHHYSIFDLEEGLSSSSILAWKIPWTEEPGGLQFIGLQRVGHKWVSTHRRWWFPDIFFPVAMAFWNAWSILWGEYICKYTCVVAGYCEIVRLESCDMKVYCLIFWASTILMKVIIQGFSLPHLLFMSGLSMKGNRKNNLGILNKLSCICWYC